MTIYKIHSDDAFSAVHPDMKEISIRTPDRAQFLKAKNSNASFQDTWVELEGIIEGKKPLPDISRLSGPHMVLSPKAYDILLKPLSKYGEFLSILLKGDYYHLFRCLNWINKVDPNKSRLDEFDEIIELSFLPVDIENQLIWVTRFGVGKGLFCECEFKSMIDDARLTGLGFNDRLVSRR